MKKITALLLVYIIVLSFNSCVRNREDQADQSSSETTANIKQTDTTDTTETSDTTTVPEQTTPEQTTTETEIETSLPETSAPEISYPDSYYEYSIDIEPYLQYICPSDDTEYLIIANRKHPLGKDYAPSDLIKVSKDQTWLLRTNAKYAFEAMRLEMQKLKVYDTYNRSTYRSYSFQNTLYNKYLENERKDNPSLSTEELMKIVDTYSARPGTSDHQTGLTIDFNPLDDSFENLKAFQYMKDNAHKFGFILRYPEGKTNITGYMYEPWHWRFVGREAATYIYENDLTLEEYVAFLNNTELEYFE